MRTPPIEKMSAVEPAPLQLDVRGLSCPLPVIKTHRALRDLPQGTELVLLTTDRTSLKDISAFCAAKDHQVLKVQESVDEVSGCALFRFHLKRGPVLHEGMGSQLSVSPDTHALQK